MSIEWNCKVYDLKTGELKWEGKKTQDEVLWEIEALPDRSEEE